MKKNFIKNFAAISLIAMAALSCAKEITRKDNPGGEEEPPVVVHTGYTLNAGLEQPGRPQTASVLDGTNVLWTSDDELSLLSAGLNVRMYNELTEAAASATFYTDDEFDPGENAVYAVYPYRSDNVFDGGLQITVPPVQVATPGTFAPGANITVGQVSDGAVTMYNVCALVEVTVTGNDVASVDFYGNGGEVIAGIVKVQFDGENHPFVSSASGKDKIFKSVRLVPASGDSYIAPGKYYIAVLPTDFTGGFTIRYNKDASSGIYEGSIAYDLQRAHVLPLGTKEASAVYPDRKVIEFHFAQNMSRDIDNPTKPTRDTWPFTQLAGTKTYTYYTTNPTSYDYNYLFQLNNTGKNTYWNSLGWLQVSGSIYFPAFVHKKLAFVTLEQNGKVTTFNTTDGDPLLQPTLVAGSYRYLDASSNTKTYYALDDFLLPTSTDNKQFYVTENPQFTYLKLVYEGDNDKEEVCSVHITDAASVELDGSEATLSGVFEAWNFTDNSLYTAGFDYRIGDGDWTTVVATIDASARTFSATLSDPEVGSYEYRPWAALTEDYTSDASMRVFGEYGTFAVKNYTKVISISFLNAAKTSRAWPFTSPGRSDVTGGSSSAAGSIDVEWTGTTSDGYTFVFYSELGFWTNSSQGFFAKGGSATKNSYITLPAFDGFMLDVVTIEKGNATSGGVQSTIEIRDTDGNTCSDSFTFSAAALDTHTLVLTENVNNKWYRIVNTSLDKHINLGTITLYYLDAPTE